MADFAYVRELGGAIATRDRLRQISTALLTTSQLLKAAQASSARAEADACGAWDALGTARRSFDDTMLAVHEEIQRLDRVIEQLAFNTRIMNRQ